MTADEALPWLFLVMAAGTFLVGVYLLIAHRQAMAAGAESNKIKFLGVEIESSTSGTTLVILAIVATVLIISLGIAPAGDDDNKADIGDTTGNTDPTGPTEPTTTPPPGPEPSGLSRAEHVLSTSELNSFTTTLTSPGVTWASVLDEERPALNCLRGYMKDFDGALKPLAFDKWRGNPPETTAEAASTVTRFESAAKAEAAYNRLVGWLNGCGDVAPLEGGRQLDVANAGHPHEVDGEIFWRNYAYEGLPDCIPCMVTDSQAVGRVDDTVVIFSISWVDPSMTFVADGGPIQEIMEAALDEAD